MNPSQKAAMAKRMLKIKPIARTVIPSLRYSRLDLTKIQRLLREELLKIINSMGKVKAIVVDMSFLSIVNCYVSYQKLTENGVKKIFRSDADLVEIDEIDTFMFFIHNTMKSMMEVIKQIRELKKKQICVFLIPRKIRLFERLLEKYGVLHKVKKIHSFAQDLIPLDSDLLVSSLQNSFYELEMNGNLEVLTNAARALVKFESMYGLFDPSCMHFIGENAEKVLDIVKQMHKDLGKLKISDKKSNDLGFNELIVFDRKLDLYTPLMTPLTFEALMDAIWGVKVNGVFQMSQIEPGKKTKIILNDDDEVFRSIRYLDHARISRSVKEITEDLRNFERMEKNPNDPEWTEKVREILIEIPKYHAKKASLDNLLSVAQKMQAARPKLLKTVRRERDVLLERNSDEVWVHIENLIIQKEKLSKVLKYIVLFSLVNNGIKKKVFGFLRTELFNSYGMQSLLLISQMQDLGLVKVQEKRAKKVYSQIRKKMDLLLMEQQEIVNGIHYVFGGFGALSVLLIKEFLENGERLSTLPQNLKLMFKTSENKRSYRIEEERKIVLFFVGGITRAEIASLRHLEKMNNLKFIIMASERISDFMEQFTGAFSTT